MSDEYTNTIKTDRSRPVPSLCPNLSGSSWAANDCLETALEAYLYDESSQGRYGLLFCSSQLLRYIIPFYTFEDCLSEFRTVGFVQTGYPEKAAYQYISSSNSANRIWIPSFHSTKLMFRCSNYLSRRLFRQTAMMRLGSTI
jgi:hypothetical protein